MKCKVIVLGLTSLIAMFLSGCGSKDTSPVSEPAGIEETTEVIGGEGVPTGRIAFRVTYVMPSGKAAKPAVVDTVTAYVYESDGTKIAEANLEKVGDRGKASITVPAGDNWRVDLVAYDGGLVSWLGSDQDVDVGAGQTTTAEVTMKPFVPTLAELVSPDIDGSYTVTWSAVEEATEYAVQESVDQAFSSYETIYTGTDTTTVVEGRRDGMYWYRVRATSEEYKDGVWCTLTSIDVAVLGVPVLETIPSPDEDGTYTVRWSSASHAERYIVEEDSSEAFSSPTEVYAGTGLSVDRTGMAQGTYWYRVKATNADGESAWSDAIWVEVVTEGTIDIDVPWPSDGGAPAGMVLIPAGSFQMGDSFNEGDSDELPVHPVTVDAFYMDVYEVTNAQFKAFIDATEYQTTAKQEGKSWVYTGTGDDWDWSEVNGAYWAAPEGPGSNISDRMDHPVVHVSWYDVAAYCNWRSRQEGLEELYNETTWEADLTKNGYRLPTEAEWEYAARGHFGEKYPWVYPPPAEHTIDHSDANYWGVGDRDRWTRTSPVGSFFANYYGLYDMGGNVWEWCNDWYDESYYSWSQEYNPTGPATGTYRVLRGGSWYNNPLDLRCANRLTNTPANSWGDLVGFRCAKTP